MNRQRQNIFFAVKSLLLFLPFILSFASVSVHEESAVHEDNEIRDINGTVSSVMELFEKGKSKEAVDLIFKLIKNEPKDSFTRTLLVQTFDLFLEEEIRAAKIAMMANHLDHVSYARAADALLLLGERSKALEILTNGVSLNRKSDYLWSRLAKLELESGRKYDAIAIFKDMIKRDGKNADALNSLASVIVSNFKDYELDEKLLAEALSYAKKACDIEPKNTSYLNTFATLRFKSGHKAAALMIMEKAIKISPNELELKEKLKSFEDDEEGFLAK